MFFWTGGKKVTCLCAGTSVWWHLLLLLTRPPPFLASFILTAALRHFSTDVQDFICKDVQAVIWFHYYNPFSRSSLCTGSSDSLGGWISKDGIVGLKHTHLSKNRSKKLLCKNIMPVYMPTHITHLLHHWISVFISFYQ